MVWTDIHYFVFRIFFLHLRKPYLITNPSSIGSLCILNNFNNSFYIKPWVNTVQFLVSYFGNAPQVFLNLYTELACKPEIMAFKDEKFFKCRISWIKNKMSSLHL